MRAIWRIERGSVEEVRRALPSAFQSKYTTIQTVLNRLADRGLLRRKRVGVGIQYSARVSESQYLARSLDHTLADATPDARRAALAQLVGNLDPAEMAEIQDLARTVNARRRR